MQNNIKKVKNLKLFTVVVFGDKIMDSLFLLLPLIFQVSVTQMQTLAKVKQLNVN